MCVCVCESKILYTSYSNTRFYLEGIAFYYLNKIKSCVFLFKTEMLYIGFWFDSYLVLIRFDVASRHFIVLPTLTLFYLFLLVLFTQPLRSGRI